MVLYCKKSAKQSTPSQFKPLWFKGQLLIKYKKRETFCKANQDKEQKKQTP